MPKNVGHSVANENCKFRPKTRPIPLWRAPTYMHLHASTGRHSTSIIHNNQPITTTHNHSFISQSQPTNHNPILYRTTIMLACETPSKPKQRRQPLTPWELSQLLPPLHTYRRAKQKRQTERPHFARILAFVHRNRFAVASQIQRRFSEVLRSDRTARRDMEEMASLGYRGVAPARGVTFFQRSTT